MSWLFYVCSIVTITFGTQLGTGLRLHNRIRACLFTDISIFPGLSQVYFLRRFSGDRALCRLMSVPFGEEVCWWLLLRLNEECVGGAGREPAVEGFLFSVFFLSGLRMNAGNSDFLVHIR